MSTEILIDRALLAEVESRLPWGSDLQRELRAALAASPAVPQANSQITGWPEGMLQDDHAPLSKALASNPVTPHQGMVARIAELEAELNLANTSTLEYMKERNQARDLAKGRGAELAALKNQDPIGIIRQRIDGVGGLWVQWTTSVSSNAKLYAAAGAREKPES